MNRLLPLIALLAACPDLPGKDEDENTDTPAEVDCTDPDSNPYLGTCVETYAAGCFDPAGSCSGVVEITGETTLTWDSGAEVHTVPTFADPMNPGAETTLYASSGATCAVGQTNNNVGACASQTVYTRESDGAQLGFCIHLDGAIDVTCPDGSTFAVSASQGEAAASCQYGGDASEPCDVETPDFEF